MVEEVERYADRRDAGRRLVSALAHLRGAEVTVLGLPCGGVPVAYEVAAALRAPLDVIVVRKLGVPGHAELAMGAVGEDGVHVADEPVLWQAHVTEPEFRAVLAREQAAVVRRGRRYRDTVPRLDLTGRTTVIIDDGMATGSTARVACAVARAHGAARIVLAVPVAAPEAATWLERDADEVVCPLCPTEFGAVGRWYRDFRPTSDDEVVDLLSRSRADRLGGP
ncbi:phosphoribosyltransferase [Kutzneria sp. CA-103260]|uniref:phosphoribosyltransferase n=1 Tax=Kutzneria sp. CA-103260 TaxID=2802641 RepID=UPI001BA4A4A9|nr:phosphoribosyltransferase family protein [Kutzneria sp. CA-103260]QUQ64092.1 phosphoribosyltransferase [Kutzneria sp. CA-103260]